MASAILRLLRVAERTIQIMAKAIGGRRTRRETPSSKAVPDATKSISQTEAAVAMIRANIIDMSLEPSSRIDEALLIKEFGLGRTPAREAINRLAAEGFVNIHPNRGGTFVRKLDFLEMSEVVVAYQIAETICAQLCRFEDPNLLADLRSIQVRYEKEVKRRAYLQITQINEEFHLRLSRTIGNSLVYEFARSAHRHVRRLLVLIYRMEEEDGAALDQQFEINLVEHSDIIDAIEARDRVTLLVKMPAHARQTQERLLRILNKRPAENFRLGDDLVDFARGARSTDA
jgi:DNA-binding GntR family transcriptional regulator